MLLPTNAAAGANSKAGLVLGSLSSCLVLFGVTFLPSSQSRSVEQTKEVEITDAEPTHLFWPIR